MMENKEQIKNPMPLEFIKEVAKYFMDFLETDFHRRKQPKRSVHIRNSDNLLIGLNLNKYPTFSNLIWKLINQNFIESNIVKIKKGEYRITLDRNLIDLIKLQTEKITEPQILEIITAISEEIKKSAKSHSKNYDHAYSTSIETAQKIINRKLVLPFISNIDKPLSNINFGDENVIFMMEEELTSALVTLLETKISEVLKLALVKEDINPIKEISSVFDIRDVKVIIVSFFESFKVDDLFSELFEMERNRSILDKQDFYYYFCDITFEKIKYPIFYIPFSIAISSDHLVIEFDSQVFINKKPLEFITQEYNKLKDKKGNLKTVTDRIIYLANHHNDFRDLINDILAEIANLFELDRQIEVKNPNKQMAKSQLVRVSNFSYISLFDKSDEALVNDYEEILRLLAKGSNVLSDAFIVLIDDFIYKNPEPVNPTVEDEWDDMEISSRLVFDSPIPLNSEQLQILSAVKKDKCKYIIVEGPPGTGKSHTITAVVFNYILENKSVLVLSDKKEALDVVEDKITETMNKVRADKNFQNPILRLGRTGSTYSQILSTSAIESIKTHFRVVKKNYETLKNDIEKQKNSLKEDIEAEILANEEIDLKEIRELSALESFYEKNKALPIDINEALEQPEPAMDLEEFRKIFLSLRNNLLADTDGKYSRIFKLVNLTFNELNIEKLQTYLKIFRLVGESIRKLKEELGSRLGSVRLFEDFNEIHREKLKEFITRYDNERNWLFGFLFKKQAIQKLDNEFKNQFSVSSMFMAEPHRHLAEIRMIPSVFEYVNTLKRKFVERNYATVDLTKVFHNLLADDELLEGLYDLLSLEEDIKFLTTNLVKYPKFVKTLNLLSSVQDLCENRLTKISDPDFNKIIRTVNLEQKIHKDFKNIPSVNYYGQEKEIEDLVTTQMTYLMDKRLINFHENNKATAKSIRDIIRSKQRFPKEEFLKLKEAFPCILAGIRDYAEYIPLEPGIFDLVIIDEASQVSIAQAFPALLRAKQILILGDKKQFSNIKSAQAKTETNREYLNNLKDSFVKNISKDDSKRVKLEKFDIKTSILEFFEFISNYNTQLLKHFRGYKEIISYSNQFFYQNKLQVMKIRGKSVNEVLKFSIIPHDIRKEPIQNSNIPEINFIISEMKKLKDTKSKMSVGIITPHTNQQKRFVEMINNLPEKEYFYNDLNLKIMTFDTCQGEERDIVFYSMVATEFEDKLWGVFIKDLKDVNIEEDGSLKAQRLNVGLSRAKECMHFVLSKPIEKYNGSIGEALRHYFFILNEAKKEKDVSEVDKSSMMEPKVLNWFYQTNFWKNEKDNIEFKPQFELGKYLKQLEPTYTHPAYKVDFLLVYRDKSGKEHKIIIEYDGFEEHFMDPENTNEFNYPDYYSKSDIYRQKVLESYRYKFLRINRFNVGKDPISALNERIEDLIHPKIKENQFLNHLYNTVEGLQSGDKKECPKCKEIRDVEDFKDASLKSGFGRFCKHCKAVNSEQSHKAKETQKPETTGERKCAKCNSKMILRSGRYGKFYGCSRYPYCKSIQKY